uniref:Uncharacterized protein n=1 Tax=Plectus sambesii TaxID=2011161 RepID=A0A914V0P4_9BILA
MRTSPVSSCISGLRIVRARAYPGADLGPRRSLAAVVTHLAFYLRRAAEHWRRSDVLLLCRARSATKFRNGWEPAADARRRALLRTTTVATRRPLPHPSAGRRPMQQRAVRLLLLSPAFGPGSPPFPHHRPGGFFRRRKLYARPPEMIFEFRMAASRRPSKLG